MECVICFAVAMASVMGNRLCLNIRSLTQHPEDKTDATKHPLSTLTFSYSFPFAKTRDENQGVLDTGTVERSV